MRLHSISLFSNSFQVALIIAGVLACHGPAAAQTKPDDLPPPPGALARELNPDLQIPADNAGNAAKGTANTLVAAIEIPFIYEGGHIIIEASIGGAAPKPFLFDTGGRNLITPDVAQTFKAEVVRTSRIGGVGAKVSQVEMIDAGRIVIGGATLEGEKVGVVEIPNVVLDRGSRPRLAGLIGSELLGHYVVTIDYARRTLTLNTRGFRPQAAKFSLPLGLGMSPDGLSHPSISAELDGVAGDFLLDTGAGGQVTVSERFQAAHEPFGATTKTLHFLSPGGIGGRASMRMGFGRELRFGPYVLSSPIVTGIDHGNSKMGNMSHVAGVIGNVVLQNFVITIDLAGARAYFEPIADRPHATVVYGNGMILDKPDHDTFEVLDVLKDSAAERAGLRPGDRVVAIADHPARDLGIADVHSFAPKSIAPVSVLTADHRKLDLSYGRLLP